MGGIGLKNATLGSEVLTVGEHCARGVEIYFKTLGSLRVEQSTNNIFYTVKMMETDGQRTGIR